MFNLRMRAPEGQSILYPVDKLVGYGEEIFKPYDGLRLGELIKSIKGYGILTPLIVRDTGEDYEVLSGHNRLLAAKHVKFKYVPVYNVGKISDADARFIVTESNIIQRGFMEFSISERARFAAIRYKAMESCEIFDHIVEMIGLIDHDGRRSLIPLDRKYVEDSPRLSPRSIRRYIRINMLPDKIKDMLDSGKISINVGVNFSYLTQEEQDLVLRIMEEEHVGLPIKAMEKIRILVVDDEFNEDNVRWALGLGHHKKEKSKYKPVRIRQELIGKYFSGYSEEDIKEVIDRALDMWFEEK